jgi:SHS family lactate transporter-like MFS transporter
MAVEEPWTRTQRDVVIASYLGWMLDAFDFFLVVFVLSSIAGDFHARMASVTLAIFVTMAMRPVGALLFGRIADRFGRRGALMASVLLYSLLEFASAFAPTLTVFLVLRALFGIAMGGEWGVGAALAFESVPQRSRGWVSGVLQAGYPSGYLLASIAFGLLYEPIGWRSMFMVGALPGILLVFFIRSRVPESPAFATPQSRPGVRAVWDGLSGHWSLVLYGILLMTAFAFFSHGTQDLYPTLLGHQRGFGTGTVARIGIVYNVGAICGGICFGTLSHYLGRRRAIALAALLTLPALPFWAFATGPVAVAIAAFVVQFMVQGAWGVVPVHLNELSPSGLRAMFPGVVYQFGNLLASGNATLQTLLAVHRGSEAHPDYAFALALFCGIDALLLCALVLAGPERRGVRFEPP